MMFKIILQVAVVAITVGARSEVKAGANTILSIRLPMAKCSALSCDVSATVQSEYPVNEQWAIFKNHTAMRITEWNSDPTKYSGGNKQDPKNCKAWCNYTVTLVIQKPKQFEDYGYYQLILKSYMKESDLYDTLVINFTVPSSGSDQINTKSSKDENELPFTTILVILVAGTCVTIFICFTVCMVVVCRRKNPKKKKPRDRKNRPHSSLGVSTHVYEEVESVANAYCEINEENRKTSAHQYIQPIPEETAIYKAPEIFSNTESPTTGRTQIQESSNDAMGYLQPSVKFRPEMAMVNRLYEEANKQRDKKPLEPTYSNSREEQLSSTKELKTIVDDLQEVLEKSKKDSDNIYAQPFPTHKRNITNKLYEESNKTTEKTTQEPTYGNEQRTPLLPKKVSNEATVKRSESLKESSEAPNVPPKPFSRHIHAPNQLYDEREKMYSQKKPLTVTTSNPPPVKLPQRKFSRSRSEDSELSHVHSYKR
ncbi:uncharacterized protein LOC125678230 isoform X2 [Ostrea edulis]|uniref:uncharacterized protein LOC125678230 isoform X2 n=1 Tax=Ostrea edulis TaxID=37623 RepID=UPI0020957B99|nr:uncharacterized protein LOC125678230 isoform X2 [Ostrea edulis]